MLKDARGYLKRLDEAAATLSKRISSRPSVGLILGSGLGDFLEDLPQKLSIPYSQIPHFPRSTVVGHSGNLVLASFDGLEAVFMQGRVHYYEGYPIEEVVFPVRVLIRLGVKSLVITNAAGGINRTFRPSDLMLISDHINLMGSNPLLGVNVDDLGPRFPDMTEVYSRRLASLAEAEAANMGISLQRGVYAGLAGPSYETPAEIRMLAALGADAVGMSTVPEAIAASHAGVEVLGISCISNMAAGILDRKLEHSEVMETANRVRETFSGLLCGILRRMAAESSTGGKG